MDLKTCLGSYLGYLLLGSAKIRWQRLHLVQFWANFYVYHICIWPLGGSTKINWWKLWPGIPLHLPEEHFHWDKIDTWVREIHNPHSVLNLIFIFLKSTLQPEPTTHNEHFISSFFHSFNTFPSLNRFIEKGTGGRWEGGWAHDQYRSWNFGDFAVSKGL